MVRFFEDYNGSAVARIALGAQRLCVAIELFGNGGSLQK